MLVLVSIPFLLTARLTVFLDDSTFYVPHTQRFSDFRKKAEEQKLKQSESKTPKQNENAENVFNQCTTPPSEALPPTKYSTLFRPRKTETERKRVLADKSTSGKTVNVIEPKRSTAVEPKNEQEELIFSGDTPLLANNEDLNTSAWAMMGDSEEYDWKISGIADEDGIALLNSSLISLNESQDATVIPPKTPARAGTDTPQVLYGKWNEKSSKRLHTADGAKKQDNQVPGKGSPFDTFRRNTTDIAVDETTAYIAKIKELEEALEAERSQRNAPSSTKIPHRYQTPAPFRGNISSTPASVMSSGLDLDSLYARNQTLVKEVRFAEQTCIEVSGKNQSLEKQIEDLQHQLETQRQENQELQVRLVHLDRDKSTATSLEASWKSRVEELESMLATLQDEKSKALQDISDWERRYKEAQEKADRQKDSASDREGKLMRTILNMEKLTKDLEEVREQYQASKERADFLEQSKIEQQHRFEEEKKSLLQESGEREKQTKSELDKSLNEIQLLQQSLESVQENYNKSVSKVQLLENANEELKQLVSDTKKDLEASKQQFENQMEELKLRFEKDKEGMSTEASQERQRLLSQLHTVEFELQQKETNLGEARSTIETLTEQLSEAKKHQSHAIKKLEEERDHFSKEISTLSLESESLRHDLEEAEKSRMALQRKYEAVADSQKLYEETMKDLDNEISELKQQKDIDETALAGLQQSVSDLSTAMNTAQNDNVRLRKIVSELEKKKVHLETQLTKSKTSLQESESERSKMDEELKSIQKLLDATDKDRKALENESNTLLRSLDEVTEKLRNKEEAHTRVLGQLAEERDVSKILKKTTEELQTELHSFQTESKLNHEELYQRQFSDSTLQSIIDHKVEEIENLRNKLSEVDSMLEEANRKSEHLSEVNSYIMEFLMKFPTHLDDFCTEMEEQISNSTCSLRYRIDVIAQVGSFLKGAIIFEQDWEQEENISNNEMIYVDSGSDSSTGQRPTEEEVFLSPTSTRTSLVSPTRTVNLELMEEARGLQIDTTPTSLCKPNCTRARDEVSDTFSSIAGLSHLFDDEEMIHSPGKNHEHSPVSNVGVDRRGTEILDDQAEYSLKESELAPIPLDDDVLGNSSSRNARKTCVEHTIGMNRAEQRGAQASVEMAFILSPRKEELEEEGMNSELICLHCQASKEYEKVLEEKLTRLSEEVKISHCEFDKVNVALQEALLEKESLQELVDKLEIIEREQTEKINQTLLSLQNIKDEKLVLEGKLEGAFHDLEALRDIKEERIVTATANISEEMAYLSKLKDDAIASNSLLKENIANLKVEHKAETEKLSCELKRARQELKDREIERNRLVNSIEAHESNASDMESIREKLDSELSALKTKIKFLTADLETAQEDAQTFRSEIKEKERRIVELQTELNNVREAQEQTIGELKNSSAEKSKLAKENSDLKNANKDMVSIAQDNRRLSQQLEISLAEKTKMDLDFQSTREHALNLEKEVKDLREQVKRLASTLEEANKSMDDSQKEVQATRMRLAVAHEESSQLRSKQYERDEIEASLKSQLEVEQQCKQRYANKISNLDEANRELRYQNEELEQENEGLRNDLAKKSEQQRQMKHKLASLHEDISALKSENLCHQNNFEALSSEKTQLENRIAALTQEINEANDTITTSEICRRAAEEIVEDTTKRLTQLQSDFENLESSFGKLRDECEAKERTIESLQLDTSNADDRAKTFENKYHQKDEETQKLSAAIEKLKSEKSNAFADCEALRSGLDFAEQTIAELEQQLESNKLDLKSLHDEIKSKELLILSLKESSDAADQLARSMEDKCIELHQSLMSLENERDSLREERESARQRHSDKDNEIHKLLSQIEKIKADRQKSVEEIEEMRKQVAAAREVAQDYEVRLNRARNEIGILNSQRDTWNTACEKEKELVNRKTNEICLMQKNLADYRERLAQSEGSIAEATAAKKEIQQENEKIRLQRDALKGECDDLRRRINELEREVLREQCKIEKLNAKHRRELESTDHSKVVDNSMSKSSFYRLERVELLAQLDQKENELASCKETILELKKKSKRLREYTRKVARKCDDWEIYYEKENGITGNLP